MKFKEYERITKLGQEMAKEQEKETFKDIVKNSDEIAAALKREQFKKIRVKSEAEDLKEKLSESTTSSEPAIDEKYGWENPETAARPIGKWQTVETK